MTELFFVPPGTSERILGEGDIAVPLGTKEDSIDFGTCLSPRWGFRLLSLSAHR